MAPASPLAPELAKCPVLELRGPPLTGTSPLPLWWFDSRSSPPLNCKAETCILLCSPRGLLLVPCFFLSHCRDLNPMGHSCAVASASAKPQSTCPLHGAAVSDLPGVQVPHQLPWVPPGCGNDPQPLSQHDVAGKCQPVDLASRPSLWPMGRVTDWPMRWEQKRRVLLWAQAVRAEEPSLPAPPLNVDARDVLGAHVWGGLPPWVTTWCRATCSLPAGTPTRDRRRESWLLCLTGISALMSPPQEVLSPGP